MPASGRRPGRRMAREERTVEAMVGIYCRALHGSGPSPCAECGGLLAYARQRLARCPFQEGKTACSRCPVHCYRPEMRERVREVMRFAGPRMLWRHPILALLHVLDGRREPRGQAGTGALNRGGVPADTKPSGEGLDHGGAGEEER